MPKCWKHMVAKLTATGLVDLTCCPSYEQLDNGVGSVM